MIHIALPQQSSLVKEYRQLQVICNNIFNHFAKPLLLFTQMHSKKVGGVSCLVQKKHKTLFANFKRLFGSKETILQW